MKRSMESVESEFILDALPDELIKVIFLSGPCREWLFVSRKFHTLLAVLEVNWYDLIIRPWVNPVHGIYQDSVPCMWNHRCQMANTVHDTWVGGAIHTLSPALRNGVALFFDSIWRAGGSGISNLIRYLGEKPTDTTIPISLAYKNYHRRDMYISCEKGDTTKCGLLLFNGPQFYQLYSGSNNRSVLPCLCTTHELAHRLWYIPRGDDFWEHHIKPYIINYYNKLIEVYRPLCAPGFFQFECDHVKGQLRPYRTNWLIYDESLYLIGAAYVLYEYETEPIATDKKKHLVLMNCVTCAPFEVERNRNYVTELMLWKYLLETNYDVAVDSMFLLLLEEWMPYVKIDVVPEPLLLESALEAQRAYVADLPAEVSHFIDGTHPNLHKGPYTT